MYRIEYRSEDHPEFGYSHCYMVKCKARIVKRHGKRRVEWEAERKIAHELADKAWAEENLNQNGFVKVRPMTNYKNIYYALRYIYDQPATDIRNRVQRRH